MVLVCLRTFLNPSINTKQWLKSRDRSRPWTFTFPRCTFTPDLFWFSKASSLSDSFRLFNCHFPGKNHGEYPIVSNDAVSFVFSTYRWIVLTSCRNLLIFTGPAGQIVSPWVTWWQGYEQWNQRRYHEFGNAMSHNPGYSRNRNSLHNNDYLVSMNTTNMCMIAKEFQSYIYCIYIYIWIMIIDLSHETHESTSSKLMGSSTHWVHFALGLGLRWTSCLYADVDQPCTTKDAGITNRWLMSWDPREVQGLLLHGMH